MMLSVVDTELWLSAEVETEDTVGAVVSVLVEVLLSSSIPSSFEDEVLHHAKKMWSKSIRKNKLIIVSIGNYILSQI